MPQSESVNLIFARNLIHSINQAGIGAWVLSPGARSAPLAAALIQEGITPKVLVDERSAGFYALGVAHMSAQPVVLVCTSGSAASHYLPALQEAAADSLPLIVLQADRPGRMLHSGGAQTVSPWMDGSGVFRWTDRIEVSSLASQTRANAAAIARSMAQQLLFNATNYPAGPVGLTVGFDEPLLIKGNDDTVLESRLMRQDPPLLNLEDAEWIAQQIAQAIKPLVLLGPGFEAQVPISHILAMAKKHDLPVASELPLSDDETKEVLRFGRIWVSALQEDGIGPDLLLRFGKAPINRAWEPLLGDPVVKQIQFDGGGQWTDPWRTAISVVRGDIAGSLDRINAVGRYPRAPGSRSDWLTMLYKLDQIARKMIEKELSLTSQMHEGVVARWLSKDPNSNVLLVGNSTPVRAVSRYALSLGGQSENASRLVVSRGTNGIDGQISLAMGVAAVSGAVTLWVGDLTLRHDLGTLYEVLAQQIPIRIVVTENGEGAIFRETALAENWQDAGHLFLTPQMGELAFLLALPGWLCTKRITHPQELETLPAVDGPELILISVDSIESVRVRKELDLTTVSACKNELIQMHNKNLKTQRN